VHTSNIILDGNGYTVSGVSLQGTLNVTVKNFTVASQGERIGMSLNDASNNLIVNNTVSGFWSVQALNGILFAGIYVVGGNSNTITQNNLMYNLDGMEFTKTSHNLIVQNTITSNPVWSPYTTGISFFGASDNTIYHNNFVNCTYLVKVSDSINAWDDGYLGNYWSDYKAKYPSAVQMGDSGVYNIPYSIDTQNIDRYPLAQPFDSEFYAPKVPPKISILSPVNQVFNESSVPLFLTVDKQVNWIGRARQRDYNGKHYYVRINQRLAQRHGLREGYFWERGRFRTSHFHGGEARVFPNNACGGSCGFGGCGRRSLSDLLQETQTPN
jgi:parallel beta-helix repeat protein